MGSLPVVAHGSEDRIVEFDRARNEQARMRRLCRHCAVRSLLLGFDFREIGGRSDERSVREVVWLLRDALGGIWGIYF